MKKHYLALFFLRFQLMLGTVSLWLGQSLVVFDVVFIVVGLPSIVYVRLGFQDLFFGVLIYMLSFIARGRLHSLLISFRLPFPLYSRISLQLSSHLWWLFLSPYLPLQVWIMFSFVYAMWAWKVCGVSLLKLWSLLSRALWFCTCMAVLTVPWFADFVSSPLPSLFSHLVAAFITASISGGSPFRYVFGLDYVPALVSSF
ncbi:hypothetical protein HID58_060039 [Brassica napus]|uniref:Uncharacterized protein n=1 Tax=Brassica napus TaxID=3708 RepID=A0ABQ7ZVA4_BRANA|nr:hypothetical protein HID58_060039 [Brassica napus]